MVTKGHNLSTMLSGVYDSRFQGRNRRDWCGHKNSEWAQFLCKWQDSFWAGPSSPDGGCQESECWVLALPQSGFFVSHTFLADRYPWDYTHLMLSLSPATAWISPYWLLWIFFVNMESVDARVEGWRRYLGDSRKGIGRQGGGLLWTEKTDSLLVLTIKHQCKIHQCKNTAEDTKRKNLCLLINAAQIGCLVHAPSF